MATLAVVVAAAASTTARAAYATATVLAKNKCAKRRCIDKNVANLTLTMGRYHAKVTRLRGKKKYRIENM